MGKLVSNSQNAFVEGRQILDVVLVANEAIDSRKRSVGIALVCKLDIEKAYDHVNWRFLLSVLEKMGFGPKWRNWIFFCISTVRMAVLVNGTPTDFFSTFRGLRQGDPLSPYLFVLIMEAFSSLISRAEENGFIRGFKATGRSGEGVLVSYLLFADHTFLFCEDNRDRLIFWKWVVIYFEVVSSLKINLQKNEIILVGGVEEVYRAAAVFGCKVENLPTNYLGLPLGASHKSCRVWDGVEERFKRKLATWKKQYLSKGGRLTLIKSTLSNLLIYFMSLFVIPRKVRLRLKKIQREFLWGDMEEKRKIHLVRWAVICKDKRHGGLGLRYLKEFNHALLGKWLWRFPTERESFWRRVIVGKFGEVQGGWTTREVRESYGTGLWKDIRKGWEEFFLRTRICIGNGRRTRFWWDIWVGDSKLKDLFPLLFRIAAHNSAVVVDLWGRQEVKVQKGEDFLVWKIERKGIFKVQSYYRSLKEDNSPLFPTKEVWGSYAPLRTRFFAWEAVWGKTSTVDMLMRRGWSMVNRCNLCKENEETTNNILIHCVYLGRAKSKNLPRGRDVRYELEETLSSVPA
ncbi:putative ribonuclease H protein [Vitis vinifera]|uniref:Putative ribonuclease H protein n=1 Tax=Vitis vinifera TaxID=29760 RepID=A0A438BT66_VITVI|nr:putative ribonuclease H protein [Vitis vinifera]